MHRILLIDDDEHLAAPLAAYLRRFDLELQSVLRPSEGLALLASSAGAQLDAVILDVMLPEMDGFEVCRRIRQTSEIPVLMLTARGELSDRVVGLELGADDYLPKPFEPRELAARLQTILRRARTASVATSASSVIQLDGLRIDPERREALRLGEVVDLTSTEFELLLLLAREPQKVFTRDEILNRLRGRDADLYTRAVDLLVSRLRRKLEPLACIKTLRNAGYTLALGKGT
jgi:OmpR family response regulator RpaB